MNTVINNENDTVIVESNFGQDEGNDFSYAKKVFASDPDETVIYVHVEDQSDEEFPIDFGLTVDQALLLSEKLLLAVKEIKGE